MKRNLTTFGLFVLALLAGAMTVYFAMPENEVQAAVEPAATPDIYVLTLDNETGLPVGAVVFTLNGLTCVALPNGAMECACPCDTGTCDASEVVPVSVPVFVPNDMPDRVDDTPATPGTSAETPGSDDGNSGIPPTDTPSNDNDGDVGDSDTGDDDNSGDNDGNNGNNRCNQGRGNGPESCDPGDSNHNQDSNDEGQNNRGGNPTPNRNNNNSGDKDKGKGKDK